ncbi:MAG: RnfABCDGE type electron transport complex subunit D [Sedimentisphaerales bacterium]|nr:RnfABCDGE type electron transport complex subunit D [Sedimentisphaerales bacterium]
MLSEIKVTPAPHISQALSTRRVMGDVCIGLMFPFIAACYYFRWYAVTLTATCVVSCVVTELVCNLLRKKDNSLESLGDLSAVVTGIILAFSVPPAFPIWAAVIGSIFAIAIGKMVFGGLGCNIFNPAMAGRAFVTASFGIMMTTWTVPATINHEMPTIGATEGVYTTTEATKGTGKAVKPIGYDVRTEATPLAHSKEAIKNKSKAKALNGQIKAAFLGEVGGCLGETSALALLIGGVFLLIRKTIDIHIPLAVLLSAFVFAAIAWLIDDNVYMSPVVHLVSGGLFICAFFIATDPVTAPITIKGMWLFGIGVGALTMLIRIIGGYPGGVMYSVLLMNAVTPMLDRLCKLTPAGGKPNAKR